MNRRVFISTATLPLLAQVAAAPQDARPRLPRKDCFFGLHFDLHPNQSDTALGRDLSEEMVDRLLRSVRPDFVQYDCKGHPGYLGYPSKVGTSSPGIVKDSLQIWRRVTARHGVALFIHFSGVWDSLAVQQHPEWAAVRPDGKPDDRATSTFGPYVDELMIPELKEAAEKYDLDGAWVDGECWAVRLDYSPAAACAFREATGHTQLPKSAQNPGWREFLELNREQFRRYVKRYVDALHAFRPNFQIASNWLYSTYAPERPELPVDFLSGDYLGNATVSVARLEARYLAATGKPWDLMAWGFQQAADRKIGHIDKPVVQLEQEASVVLAQGGGFQVYYNPTRAGRIDDRHIEVMARLAGFCRARQALSHRTETVPQIGLLFSKDSLYKHTGRLFGGWGRAVDPARGLLDALLENHYSVDIIPDWKLEEALGLYPLVVVPEWVDIGRPAQQALSRHVRRGGKLLLVGVENAALFAEEIGVRLKGAPSERRAQVLGDEVFGNAYGVWQDVEPVSAQQIELRFPTNDSTRDGACAATLTRYGDGEIAAIYGSIGGVFAATHAPAIRQFIGRVVGRLYQPMARLEGPPTVELTLRTAGPGFTAGRKGSKLLVHLGNCTAMQVAGDYAAVDFIPSVGLLRLSVQMAQRPARATLEPGGRPLRGEWKNGVWTGAIDRFHIHAICVIEV